MASVAKFLGASLLLAGFGGSALAADEGGALATPVSAHVSLMGGSFNATQERSRWNEYYANARPFRLGVSLSRTFVRSAWGELGIEVGASYLNAQGKRTGFITPQPSAQGANATGTNAADKDKPKGTPFREFYVANGPAASLGIGQRLSVPGFPAVAFRGSLLAGVQRLHMEPRGRAKFEWSRDTHWPKNEVFTKELVSARLAAELSLGWMLPGEMVGTRFSSGLLDVALAPFAEYTKDISGGFSMSGWTLGAGFAFLFH